MKKQSIFKKEEQAVTSIDPLFKEDQLNPWWHYKKYSQFEVEKINNYFTSNHEFLTKDLDGNLKSSMKTIATKIGVHLPPLFTQDEYAPSFEGFEKKEGFPVDLNQSVDQVKVTETSDNEHLSYFILNSQKLDLVTFKILNISFFSAKIKVLRINNNTFDTDTLNELIKMLQIHKIVKLFFDWNDIESCGNKEYFYEALFSKCTDLELLTLRNQHITESLLDKISQLIQTNSSQLRIRAIDFFQNNFTNSSIASLDRILSSYQKLQYLGLGANQISQLNPLIRMIGKKPITAEELAEHRKKEAERDAIILKNSKAKGKNLEEVPVLESVKEIGQDKFAYCYNEQLQYLNLIQNQFSEQDKEQIETFLVNSFDEFTLSLSGSAFDKKSIDRLKKKFGTKIQFS